MLELYDAQGALVRSVAAERDAADATRWRLAERVGAGDEVDRAVLRHEDGSAHGVPVSAIRTSEPIDVLVLGISTTFDPKHPDEPVNSL